MRPPRPAPGQLALFDLPPRPAPPAVVSGPRTEAPKVVTVRRRVDVPLAVLFRLARVDGEGTLPPEVLFDRLNALMDRRLHHLILTNNRTRILSCLPAEDGPAGSVRLRLHWCFVRAPAALLDLVAGFALGALRGPARQRALAAIREHFRAHDPARVQAEGESAEPLPVVAQPRRVVLRPRGKCFDLRQLRDEVNQRYFAGQLTAAITWGRVPARRASDRRSRKRSIHLGTYTAELNLVRIHRKLDQPWVPRFVVESVIHHEMLHAALPATVKDGRRRIHPPEFRRREREFERFAEAEAWIRKNLQRLLGGV